MTPIAHPICSFLVLGRREKAWTFVPCFFFPEVVSALLGNCYLHKFTNKTRSGWYFVNFCPWALKPKVTWNVLGMSNVRLSHKVFYLGGAQPKIFSLKCGNENFWSPSFGNNWKCFPQYSDIFHTGLNYEAVFSASKMRNTTSYKRARPWGLRSDNNMNDNN